MLCVCVNTFSVSSIISLLNNQEYHTKCLHWTNGKSLWFTFFCGMQHFPGTHYHVSCDLSEPIKSISRNYKLWELVLFV